MKRWWPDHITWYRIATLIFGMALVESAFDVVPGGHVTRTLAWIAFLILVANLLAEWVTIGRRRMQVRREIERKLNGG